MEHISRMTDCAQAVLVVAGRHEGWVQSIEPQNMTFQLLAGVLGVLGIFSEQEVHTYRIHEVRHPETNRSWWVAMPTDDSRDPSYVALRYLFGVAHGKWNRDRRS